MRIISSTRIAVPNISLLFSTSSIGTSSRSVTLRAWLEVEIIAHRGASDEAPENTLASINLGWQQNADAVEVDVYLSKDGQIVVIHDALTSKTAGVRRRVSDQTLAELKRLDVDRKSTLLNSSPPI